MENRCYIVGLGTNEGKTNMDLRRMMFAAGLGCSEHCKRQERFIASLSEEQRNDLAHLIMSGAQRHLDDIEKASLGNPAEHRQGRGRATGGTSGFGELLDKILGQPSGGLPPDFLATLRAEEDYSWEQDSVGVAPYEGPLPDDMLTELQRLSVDTRETIEKRIRLAIAAKADGDPDRVSLRIGIFGIHLLVTPKLPEDAAVQGVGPTH